MPFLVPFANFNPAQSEVLASSLVRESDVNGLWNGVFHAFSGPPNYIIKPEVRIDFNHIPDLVISKLLWSAEGLSFHNVALYEGKGLRAATWYDIRTQLTGYGRALLPNGKAVYCIGGMGRHICFWYFKKGDMIEIKPMDIDSRSGVPRIRGSSEMPPQYDIVNDVVAIGKLLNKIVIDPPS
ncbi:hypothetical protein FRC12_002265 [Ceratobasidium sp. 428]|nr:hypothetical protein FRC12_002265 [Ceratobasidium sp. 428]